MKKNSTLGILLLIIIAIGLLVISKRQPSPQTFIEPKAGLQTYHSDRLDVSFQYNASDTGILEQGNKVYVYATGTEALEGQSIERFEKQPNETFAKSIERQLLSEASTSTCNVQLSVTAVGYTRAEIAYPEPTDANAPFFQNASLCNEAYAKTNGIRYFLFDTSHPDRFYFLSIGQYPIVATGTRTWQDTLTIGS